MKINYNKSNSTKAWVELDSSDEIYPETIMYDNGHKNRTFFKQECANCQEVFYSRKEKFTRACSISCGLKITQSDEYTPYRYFTKTIRAGEVKGIKKYIGNDITIEFLKELYESQGGLCTYTGIKMLARSAHERRETGSFMTDMSLDRIDSSKGYTQDNVQFVTKFVNYGKNTGSDEETKAFIELIRL